MNDKQINERLEKLLKKITGKEIKVLEIQDKSLLSPEVGLMPTDLLDLFFGIENDFGIVFSRKEIVQNKFDRISDISRIVQKKLN